MSNIITFTTPRLQLRQWRDEDYHAFAKMNADPEVMEYMVSCLTSEQSNALAQRFRDGLEQNRWGMWAVEQLVDHQFIGFVGLHIPNCDLPVSPCVEIGWRLARAVWNQGYATEAAKACLRVAFEQIGLSEVHSFTAIINQRSQRIMKKIGMMDIHKPFEHPLVPKNHALRPHVLYRITKPDWMDQNSLSFSPIQPM